jgi:serine protease Do
MRLCIFSLIISLITAHADIISTKSWHKQVPQGIEDLVAIQERLRSLLPQTKAALVSIEAMDGAGSGVIVSEDGLVLTAAHVIGTTGKKMFVRLPDGKRAPAVSLGGSEISDAGMLQITKKKKWPFVQMAASNTSEVGDWCFGLGHPGGFDKKRGIVVRIGKVIANRDETMQTDSRLLGGDSGGPLFDFEGRLIAIHSRVSQLPDQNFHVPIDCFHANWNFFKNQDLITYEKMQAGGFFGVECEYTEAGLVVRDVIPSSAAQQAGVQINDILVSVNDKQIDSREEFIILISSMMPGALAKVKLVRNGAEFSVKVNLGSRTEPK